ncbi:MAG TPA: alpha/beta hydrolase [Actinopolymorphaceae bacterium]|jgi:pimeloyl-ACP methyl ester carboxylesterase
MSRRSSLVAGLVSAAATGVLAAGLTAEKMAIGRLRRRPDGDPGVVYGRVQGTSRRVLTPDGLSLHAELDDGPDNDCDAGGDAAPFPFTTVFVHGYAHSHDSWQPQRAALRLRGPVVSYDQRSHGRSDRAPAAACTIAACGADLACVIEQLVPTGKVVLVGHSMGGMTVMSLAELESELFADRVAGVVLAGTSAGGLGRLTFGLRGPVARVVSQLTPAMVAAAVRLPMFIEHSRKADNDLSLLIAERYSFASEVPSERVQFVAEMLAHTPIDVVADFYPTFAHHDGYAGLAEMHEIPVQILGAVQDRITPIEHSRAMAAALPSAAYAELDPSGHLLMLEHPRRVTEAVLSLAERAAARIRADRTARPDKGSDR